MRREIQYTRTQINNVDKEYRACKQELRNLCLPLEYRSRLDCLSQLNSRLHTSLLHTRNSKLVALGLILTTKDYEYAPVKVVTIPEDLNLPEHYKNILGKGLSFAPSTQKTDLYELNKDFERYARRICLRLHFDGVTPPNRTVFDFINPKLSKWTPPHDNPALDHYIDLCRKKLSTHARNSKDNISKEEFEALCDIRKEQNWVIKPADKGGAVVVWRKDLYVEEASA